MGWQRYRSHRPDGHRFYRQDSWPTADLRLSHDDPALIATRRGRVFAKTLDTQSMRTFPEAAQPSLRKAGQETANENGVLVLCCSRRVAACGLQLFAETEWCR
jgi:hypothetical protein